MKTIIYQIASDCENIKSSIGFPKYSDYLNTDLNKLIFDLNNKLLSQFSESVACLLDREKSGIHSVYFTISSLIHTKTEVPDISITYLNVIPNFSGFELKVTSEDEHKIENCILDVIFNYLNTIIEIPQIV